MGEGVSREVIAAAAAAGLALVLMHTFVRATGRFAHHRRRWTSLGGGISVAYVFLHLLPELAHGAEEVEAAVDTLGLGLERHLWLLVLIGLIVFQSVEAYSQHRREHADGEHRTSGDAFWVSVVSFAMYNAIVGYLLVGRAQTGAASLAIFTLAMLLHFAVNDASLRHHHKSRYDHAGRWLLVAAIAAGLAVGSVAELPEAWVVGFIALLAGGIIVNALKEELSVQREGSLRWFVSGAAGYAALLLAA